MDPDHKPSAPGIDSMADSAQTADKHPTSSVKMEDEQSLESALAAVFAAYPSEQDDMATTSADLAAPPIDDTTPPTPSVKRQFEDFGAEMDGSTMAADDTPPAKRAKTEDHDHGDAEGQDDAAPILKAQMDALIQNALVGLGSFMPSELPGTSEGLGDSTEQPATQQQQEGQQQQQPPPPPPLPTQVHDSQRSNRSSSTSVERENGRALSHLFSEPEAHLRTINLPVIASAASQVLLMLRTQCTNGDLKRICDEQSELGAAYARVKGLFEHARAVYVEDGLWLWEEELGVTDPDSIATLRLANLASLLSILVIEDDPFFAEAHDVFFDVVAPDGAELTPKAVDLFLAIKCKLVIVTLLETAAGKEATTVTTAATATTETAATEAPKPRLQHMADIMLGDLNAKMRQRHSGGLLPASDSAFLVATEIRKNEMYNEIGDEDNRDYLRVKLEDYHEALLLAAAAYLEERGSFFLDEASRCGVALPLPDPEPEEEPRQGPGSGLGLGLVVPNGCGLDDTDNLVQDTLLSLVQDLNQHTTAHDDQITAEVPEQDMGDAEGLDELELLVERQTRNYVQNRLSQLSPAMALPWCPGLPSPAPGTSPARNQRLSQAGALSGLAPGSRASSRHSFADGGVDRISLPPNQTVPTTVLYEKARQAAMTKSTITTRREGQNGSARRPWSPEEEKALMMGLDIVKGPHWSQILSLFGPNGSQSSILKDRTQVQLKDKARNLKLFFLKTNSEVPYYLQAVTGELKTRAPTQAARKEAEEKAREGQAKFDGTMALDSLKNHPAHGHVQRPPPPATPQRIMAASTTALNATQNTPIAAAQPARNYAHQNTPTPGGRPEYGGSMAAAVAQYTTQHQPQHHQPQHQLQHQPQHQPQQPNHQPQPQALLPASARPQFAVQTPQQPHTQHQFQPQTAAKPPLAPAPTAPTAPATSATPLAEAPMRTTTPAAPPPVPSPMAQTPASTASQPPLPQSQQNGNQNVPSSPDHATSPVTQHPLQQPTPQPALTPQQVQAQEHAREMALLHSLQAAT